MGCQNYLELVVLGEGAERTAKGCGLGWVQEGFGFVDEDDRMTCCDERQQEAKEAPHAVSLLGEWWELCHVSPVCSLALVHPRCLDARRSNTQQQSSAGSVQRQGIPENLLA